MRKTTFIGHRSFCRIGIKEKLTNIVENEINNGCKNFIIGSHGEFDEMALDVCRSLRCKYEDIVIEVVLTSLHKIKKPIGFNDEYEIEYIPPYFDVLTTMYEIDDVYFKNKIFVSNKKMVDECDTLICYVDKNRRPSGAVKILNYAKKTNKKIINVFEK